MRLRWHGLIQAFSRTNWILDARNSQGNVVCFRNLKPQVDEAIMLFRNALARDVVLVAPYDEQVERFNEAVGAPGARSPPDPTTSTGWPPRRKSWPSSAPFATSCGSGTSSSPSASSIPTT